MVVFYIISGCFPIVFCRFMGQKVLGDRLLAFTVPHILFIPKNTQHGIRPPDAATYGLFPHVIEFFGDPVTVGPADKTVIDVAHNLSLFLIDHPFPVRAFVIPQEPVQVHDGFPPLELLLDRPADVVGNGPRLILRQRRKDGQDQLPGGIQGIDILFFKVNAHRRTELAQLPYTV